MTGNITVMARTMAEVRQRPIMVRGLTTVGDPIRWTPIYDGGDYHPRDRYLPCR